MAIDPATPLPQGRSPTGRELKRPKLKDNIMEEPNPKQDPLREPPATRRRIQTNQGTSKQNLALPSGRERGEIEDGQRKARRDKREMRQQGFGSHIGVEE
jgi:hypothetical protein